MLPPTRLPTLLSVRPVRSQQFLNVSPNVPLSPTLSSTTEVHALVLPVHSSPTLPVLALVREREPAMPSTSTVFSPSPAGPLGRGTLTHLSRRLLVSALPVFRLVSSVMNQLSVPKLSRLVSFSGRDSVLRLIIKCLDTRAELESCGGCTNGYADITAGASTIGTE